MDNKESHGTGHIIQSLIVNILIASAKGFAAFMTGSGAMLAETIHSFSDCANQAVLLVGVKQAQRPANDKHPLGFGREVYFWSFMVAMLLFSIGGMFSIYEGVHKFNHPEPIENFVWGIGILLLSLALEGYATYSNIVELNKRRGKVGFFKFLNRTKDSDLVVIFGENSAAVLGLVIALVALTAAYRTGDGRFDALGSLGIGVVLILVAIFLSIKVKSLLIGESADVTIMDLVEMEAKKHPEILKLINCITIQQGPGEVLMCMKIKVDHSISILDLSKLTNKFEREIRAKAPELKWIYLETDLQEWKNHT
ncbi:MAG: cation diffusion facilitator family transporter [Saprospiraceae bacterium]